MIAEYLEAEHKGGGKDYINIEIRVKADCVHAFASSVRDATVDLVLDIIDGHRYMSEDEMWSKLWNIGMSNLKEDILALKGEQE